MTDIKSAPQNDVWDIEIDANKRGINIDLGELWRYRDLFQLFVRRDIVTVYKQTILGPIWYFIQPIFTSIIFWILFGKVAGLTSDSIPSFPFYLISINLWSYFSDILTVSSKTFTDNVSVFGKVYFPRIILPITKVISGMTKFFIQFSLFICFYIYYVFINPQIHPTYFLILAPLILLITVAFSLGLGILITSITTKYRDFYYLVTFGIQLLMYLTPVTYSLSNPKFAKYKHLLLLNPLTPLFETFKYCFFGKGFFDIAWLLYSVCITIITLIIGLIAFSKAEKQFVDTV